MTTTRKAPARKPQVTVIPDGVKQPEDRKPKTEVAKPTVKKVDGGKEVTYQGISVVVEDDALDDFELMGELRLMQDSEDPTYMPGILMRLLGREQTKTAMDALRDPETGRVSAKAGMEYVQAVFEALNPNS